jgi:hypothetical protein
MGQEISPPEYWAGLLWWMFQIRQRSPQMTSRLIVSSVKEASSHVCFDQNSFHHISKQNSLSQMRAEICQSPAEELMLSWALGWDWQFHVLGWWEYLAPLLQQEHLLLSVKCFQHGKHLMSPHVLNGLQCWIGRCWKLTLNLLILGVVTLCRNDASENLTLGGLKIRKSAGLVGCSIWCFGVQFRGTDFLSVFTTIIITTNSTLFFYYSSYYYSTCYSSHVFCYYCMAATIMSTIVVSH